MFEVFGERQFSMGLAKAKAANPDCHEISIYDIITISYMILEPTSTARTRRLRERHRVYEPLRLRRPQLVLDRL